MSLTDKQKNRLRRLKLVADEGEIGLVKEINALEDRVENLNLEKGDRGDDGDRGEDGIDGKDGRDGVDGRDGKDGADGRDGKDGKDGQNGKDGINGIDGKDGADGKDGSPDTPGDIKNKLESLKGDNRLDSEAIKGLEKRESKLSTDVINRAIGIVDQRTSFLINKVSNLENRPSGGGTWGSITGTLSNQTDLQAALDGKADALTADENYVTDAQLVVIGNTSGTNTGDQTSIVGITGTKAEFDTAVTDGNFLYVGDVTQYTDEMAQDAVGNAVGNGLDYDDTTGAIAVDETELVHNSLGSKQGGTVGEFYHLTSAQHTVVGNTSGTNTGDQNLFQTIAVSGQSNVVADSTTDTLTLVAGANVTITTDATTDSITIAASGGSGSPGGSDTEFQYNNGGAFGGVSTLTYNDATGDIVFNEAGDDNDFRMEGLNEVNLFFLDASTDRIGIGTNAPASHLQVGTQTSTETATPVTFSTGGTYADSVTSAKAKWKMYDDGTAINTYGVGISAGQMNFFKAAGGSFNWYFADVQKLKFDSSLVMTFGDTTATSTATPATLDLGGTYADAAVASKAKWKMYNDGNTSTIYGIGISAGQLNFFKNTGGTYNWYFSDVEKMRLDTNSNLMLGVTAVGTSATKTLGLGNGTEPSTSPADMVQLYSKDISAGNATLGLRVETSVVSEAVTSDETLTVFINGVAKKILLKA